MKQLVAAVSRKLPRELKNFHLIKRQSIFIPYRLQYHGGDSHNTYRKYL